MFETNDMAKMNNPLALLGDESYLWSHVSLRIHVPWFYVIFSMIYEDGSKKSDILFVSNIRDLVSMNNEAFIQIEQIYLVSPAHLNNTEKWMMEPIREIMVGLEPKHDQLAHVYIVENGNRYLDSALGSQEKELRDVKTVYENECA